MPDPSSTTVVSMSSMASASSSTSHPKTMYTPRQFYDIAHQKRNLKPLIETHDGRPMTFEYKTVDEGKLPVHLDLYLPDQPPPGTPQQAPLPTVIFFHGGGLLRGDRTAYPVELKDDLLTQNFAFISADYRLLIPCTAVDLIEDLNSLFEFIRSPDGLNKHLSAYTSHSISSINLFTAGHSGGGYLALQSGLLIEPKPRGMFLLSGQGGKLLQPHYFFPTTAPRKIKLEEWQRFLTLGHPDAPSPVAGEAFHWGEPGKRPENETLAPSWRTSLPELLQQLGLRLDILTGVDGLSEDLRKAYEDGHDIEKTVPAHLRYLFPELGIGAGFPDLYAVHGTGDRVVFCSESQEVARKIVKNGGVCELVMVKDWKHEYNRSVYFRGVRGVVEFFEKRILREDVENSDIDGKGTEAYAERMRMRAMEMALREERKKEEMAREKVARKREREVNGDPGGKGKVDADKKAGAQMDLA